MICAAEWLKSLADRAPLPLRTAWFHYSPLRVAGAAGAWAVEVGDPRFGGVSAVTLRGGRLLALTDSGVLVSLPKPGRRGRAELRDLPGGPGSPLHKRARDSESLTRDPRTGQWWVGFENRHSLWAFDRELRRPMRTIDLSQHGWPANKGAEAAVALGTGALLLLPELGSETLTFNDTGVRLAQLKGASGGVTDATQLPDGRVLVLIREIGPLGIRNRIAQLDRFDGEDRLRQLQTVAVGPLTNLEAITAEQLPSGATRLWIMSDNDFSVWRRTILLAIDLPKEP